MKLFLSLLIFTQTALAGLPPTTMQGQLGTKATTFNFQVPNRQATQTSGVNQLIETGNLNLLANPSFEHLTVGSGWSVVAGTTAAETSIIQSGLRAIALTRPTSGPIELSQSVNTAFLSGQQGFLSCRVRTNQSSMRICPLVNGVVQTDICQSIAPSSSYFNYRTAFLFGSSTSGIEIESTANGTGTTYVDDCTLQLASPSDFIDVAQIGPWIDYTPTFQGLGTPTVIDARYRVIGNAIQLNVAFTSGTSTAAELRVGLPLNLVSDTGSTTNVVVGTFLKGIGASGAIKRDLVIAPDAANYVLFSSGEYSIAANPSIGLNGNAILGLGDRASFFATVPVQGLSNKVSTYSQACVRDVDCENAFSAYSTDGSSVGTVSRESLDWVNGNGTNPATGSYIFTFQTGIFTQTPNCEVIARANAPGANAPIVCTPVAAGTNSTQLEVDCRQGGTVLDWDFEFSCQKQGVDFKAENVITGTFQDVVTSPGAGRPVLCSAKISSTGVISDQIGGCFASCTNATTPVCTFTSNFWRSGTVPNCWGSPNNGTNGIAGGDLGLTSNTSTRIDIYSGALAASVGARIYFCNGVQ